MDYTNYQNISAAPRDFLNAATPSPTSIRTVEPNRSESESTEQRLYGAYRNTGRAVRELTPDATPDAPLIYPLADDFNPNIAEELNSETATPMQTTQPRMTQPMASPGMANRTRISTTASPQEAPLPGFATASRTRNTTAPELYTPIGDKTAPQPMGRGTSTATPYSYTPGRDGTSISYQNMMDNTNDFSMYYTPAPSYPDLTTSYQRNPENNMYLPTRVTPYYNVPSEGYEDANDFEEAERDLENLKQLYPSVWRVLQGEIMEECDRLEYEGSCMFDEYPDRITIDRIIDRIYSRVRDNEQFRNYDTSNSTNANAVSANQVIYNPCPRCNWAEDFVRIMFLNEMHNRRRRYRNRRRWFY